MDQSKAPLQEFAQKRIGSVNWRGVWTLYTKEVRRFCKVFGQTVMAPVLTTILFMTIFTIALGGSGRYSGDVPFQDFLAPGLIVMAILQSAFANTVSTLMSAKMQGNIVDILLAPLGPGEMTLAYTCSGITRGLLVGTFVTLTMTFFTGVGFSHLWAVIYFALSAAIMLSLLGLIAGVWAEKFDQSAAINNFVIVPLSFLSGTFYSIDRLPGFWYTASQMNPFFYLIDGFRYGMIGMSDAAPLNGVLFTLTLNVILWVIAYKLLKSGYKLRA